MALLKEGLICRVGDGTTINIWSDPWLKRDGIRTLKTPRGRRLLTRVCELVDPETYEWDERLVRDNFTDNEARIILATPVRENMKIAMHGFLIVRVSFRLDQLISCMSEEEIKGSRNLLTLSSTAGTGRRSGHYHASQKYNTSCGVLHIRPCTMRGA